MKKMMLMLTVAMVSITCLTGCGESNESAGALTGSVGNVAIEAITDVENTEEVETVEPTEAPAAESTETPVVESDTTVEYAPIEWTTEEGTLLPTEPVVFIKGSAVKLPCTVEEFMARTGEKIFKSDVNEGSRYGMPGIAEIKMPTYNILTKTPDDAESFEDYIIYSISVDSTELYEDVCSDVTLPGDIYIGSACTSLDDLTAIYGLADAPDPKGIWWNIGNDNPGFTFDYETCAWTTEERLALSRGYCVGFDVVKQAVTNIEVNVSSDKLYELYGVR